MHDPLLVVTIDRLPEGLTQAQATINSSQVAAVMLANRASLALVETSSSGTSTSVCTSVCLTMPDALLAISRHSTIG